MILILMGVAGAGKSTIGKLVSERLRWIFLEGDDFHPKNNILKMKRGIPLTDADREPWLWSIQKEIVKARKQKRDVIIACSALKRKHRELLSAGRGVYFIYLKASKAILEQRLARRKHHFFLSTLLESQLAAFEEPADTIVIDAEAPAQKTVERIMAILSNNILKRSEKYKRTKQH